MFVAVYVRGRMGAYLTMLVPFPLVLVLGPEGVAGRGGPGRTPPGMMPFSAAALEAERASVTSSCSF